MAYRSPRSPRSSAQAVASLPLLLYLGLAGILIAADRKTDMGDWLRDRGASVLAPLWWVAGAPSRLYAEASAALRSREELLAENAELRQENREQRLRQREIMALRMENGRMRELLGAAPMRPLRAQMVPLAAVDLDPYRQRLLLAAGSEQGLRVGQVLVDSGGVLGQLVEVAPGSAQALLVTDPAHAIPVTFMRSGLRSIAYGTGQADALELPNLPRSADVRVGDLVVTSGIGGRFPPGFPVGRVVDIGPDETRLFLVARLRPAAHVERGEEVLVVDEAPLLVAPAAAPVATPPANVPAPTEGAATVAPPAAAPATTSAESAETAEQAAYELPEGTRR